MDSLNRELSNLLETHGVTEQEVAAGTLTDKVLDFFDDLFKSTFLQTYCGIKQSRMYRAKDKILLRNERK